MTQQTELYRYFDKDNNLLYVGISYDSLKRKKSHMASAKWKDLYRSMTMEVFETRELALAAEKNAIIEENPWFNIIHNTKKKDKIKKHYNGNFIEIPEVSIYGTRRSYGYYTKKPKTHYIEKDNNKKTHHNVLQPEEIECYKEILNQLQYGKTHYVIKCSKSTWSNVYHLIVFDTYHDAMIDPIQDWGYDDETNEGLFVINYPAALMIAKHSDDIHCTNGIETPEFGLLYPRWWVQC